MHSKGRTDLGIAQPYIDPEKLKNLKVFGHGFGALSEYIIEREGIDFEASHNKWAKTYDILKAEKNRC
jgi:hypothetical protein